MTRRKRRESRLGWILTSSIVAALLIGVGGLWLQTQHSGVPARIRVDSCTTGGVTAVGNREYTLYCSGGPSHYVKIYGAGTADIGHDIDVHLSWQHDAVKDGWIAPPILIGLGCAVGVGGIVSAVGGVVNLLGRRRAHPT